MFVFKQGLAVVRLIIERHPLAQEILKFGLVIVGLCLCGQGYILTGMFLNAGAFCIKLMQVCRRDQKEVSSVSQVTKHQGPHVSLINASGQKIHNTRELLINQGSECQGCLIPGYTHTCNWYIPLG